MEELDCILREGAVTDYGEGTVHPVARRTLLVFPRLLRASLSYI